MTLLIEGTEKHTLFFVLYKRENPPEYKKMNFDILVDF